MRNITHVFFDLDHTLWDFQTNSRATLSELFHELKVSDTGLRSFEEFVDTYEVVNDRLWSEYRRGEIDKVQLRSTRFVETLRAFEVHHPELALQLEVEYIKRSPFKTQLFPQAIEVLDYLSSKYSLHIITNGFREVQDIKLTESGIKPYFKSVITSEEVGVNKPDPKIFTHALKSTGAERKYSVMIGDNLEADVRGARNVGMHSVYFNPENKAYPDKLKWVIQSLSELKRWL